MSHEKYKTCIDACYACAIACDHCASEDLQEKEMAMLANCIHINRECSEFCRAAAHILSCDGKFARDICALCAHVCDACAAECGKHLHMEHCKHCADACRKCAEECRKMSA